MKKAILLVCFGNKNIEEQLKKLKYKINIYFKYYDIYICFTSKFFIKKYGYDISKVLIDIKNKKYSEILCLPIFTIDGIEYSNIKKFQNIKIAKPLLYSDEDFQLVYNFIKTKYNQNTIYICHGTEAKSNEKYKRLFNMFKDKNIFFANLESSPYIEDTIKILKIKNIKNICVKPFLLFEGKHIQNDIAYTIKYKLLESGINVTLDLKPLLQYEEIINIFIKHLKEVKEF